MDKIWDRNPSKSEVIGRCGGDEKTEWPRSNDKSRTLKKTKTVTDLKPTYFLLLHNLNLRVNGLAVQKLYTRSFL